MNAVTYWILSNCRFAESDVGYWHGSWQEGEGIGVEDMPEPTHWPTNLPKLVYHGGGTSLGDINYTDIGHDWGSIIWIMKGGKIFSEPMAEESGSHGSLNWTSYDWKGRYDQNQGLLSITGLRHPPPDVIDRLAFEFPKAKVFHLFGIRPQQDV